MWNTQARASVLVAAVFFTAGGAIARGIEGSPVGATAARLLLAGPILLAAAASRGQSVGRGIGVRAALLPAVLFAMAAVLSQASFQSTSFTNATLIPATAPFVLMLVEAVAFRSWPQLRTTVLVVATMASLFAFVLLRPDSGDASVAGDLAAAGFLVAYAAYFLAVKRLRSELEPLAVTGLVLTGASIPTSVIAIGSGSFTTLSGEDLLRCALVVVASTIIGQTLVSSALGSIDASESARLLLMQPVAAAFVAAIIFDETLSGTRLALGATVVVLLLVGLGQGGGNDAR